MAKNLYQQDLSVDRNARELIKGHKGTALWFTGLSGSGKSTIAAALHRKMTADSKHSYMLDGDNIRLGINNDLDFSPSGRKENIRRIAEIAKLFVDSGMIVLCSFISPYRKDREEVKQIIGSEDYMEIYVNCPLEVCEERDVKGLYAKARKGLIPNFTGIDAPYEAPESPFMELRSDLLELAESTDLIYDKIKELIKL